MNEENEEVIEEEVEVEQEDSLRDVIEEAYTESEETTDGDDEAGDKPSGDTAEGDDGEARDGEQVADTASAHKAPAGWNAESKEHWGKIPEGVQAQIAAREDEVARTIHGTLDARRTHEYLSKLSDSYAPVLAAEGVSSPVEAIEGLFKTVSVLRLGSPQQKATQLANIIGTYGIDVGMLDSALSGQGFTNDGTGGKNADIEHLINTKMQPMNDLMASLNQIQGNAANTRQENANNEVMAFAGGEGGEFLNDVRNDMADLLDIASNQGREMTLKEAYDKCCSMNPGIQKVLADRAANTALIDGKRKVVGKLNAGSSIRGNGAPGPGKAGDVSLRDQISSIWDEYAE